MSKSKIRSAELDVSKWLAAEDPLTKTEKALLELRIAAYEKNPEVGSSWEEVEARVRSRLKK